MGTRNNLWSLAQSAMYITAAVFGLLGLVLFLAPAWSAANFPWKITPMVIATMGGWYLGSAAMAALVARYRRWSLMYACALYVIVFSMAETAVLIVHASLVKLNVALAWPYIGMLAIAVVSSLLVLVDWVRQRPDLTGEGELIPTWVRGITVIFVLFVFFLAGVAFSGSWVGLNGVIFPEPLSLFTLHSFGAFYFSLAFAALPLLRARTLEGVTPFVQGGMVLIVLITAAGFVFFGSFNFAAHRFQAAYLGVYLTAFVIAGFYLLTQRGKPSRSAAAASTR